MKTRLNLTAILALLATLFTSSAFADWRHQSETYRDHRGRQVTLEGRIRDIDRERNGFVFRIDLHNYLLFAPAQTEVRVDSRRRRHARVHNLERGDRIRVSGSLDDRRIVHVDHLRLLNEEDDRWDRDDRTLHGVVQSVDRSRRLLWLRENRSGRVVAVDLRGTHHNRRGGDFDHVRRGDRIVVSGDWRRDGRFEAERLDIDRRWGR